MLKNIFLTFSATLIAVALAASLALNSILGAFSLAAISVGTLVQLQASQRIVKAMKDRHLMKKAQVTKRFVKRSGRRVASTALAAATFGTVAVAAALTAVEVSDYCDQKAELQEEANLIFGTTNEFDLEQCLNESREDAKAILAEAKKTVTSSISDAFDTAGRYSRQMWASVTAATDKAVNHTNRAFTSLWAAATSRFSE